MLNNKDLLNLYKRNLHFLVWISSSVVKILTSLDTDAQWWADCPRPATLKPPVLLIYPHLLIEISHLLAPMFRLNVKGNRIASAVLLHRYPNRQRLYHCGSPLPVRPALRWNCTHHKCLRMKSSLRHRNRLSNRLVLFPAISCPVWSDGSGEKIHLVTMVAATVLDLVTECLPLRRPVHPVLLIFRSLPHKIHTVAAVWQQQPTTTTIISPPL